MELYHPLEASAEVFIDSHISDIVDKGRAAIVYTDGEADLLRNGNFTILYL